MNTNKVKNIIILLILLLGINSCKNSENKKKEESFYATRPIIKDTLVYQEYVCQIRSIQHIELRALEKGYIQKIFIDEGQQVKKGQLLFTIIPVIYQAETQKAQAEVNFAEIEYQNAKALADSHIVSKNELALAEAKLKKAKSELALTQAHLNFTEIKAPFDGMIGRFYDVRVGSLVSEGDLLTTLSDNSKTWVYFNVPETEYLNYITNKKKDSVIRVKLKLANNQVYEEDGNIETIEADFNNETGNIAFRATFPNPSGILRNGETGNILMPVKLNKKLFIPQKSTFEILDKKYVFVINNENIAEAKEIEVGHELQHLYTVEKGINNKDVILTDGLRKVKNGQHVNYVLLSLDKIVEELNHMHAE